MRLGAELHLLRHGTLLQQLPLVCINSYFQPCCSARDRVLRHALWSSGLFTPANPAPSPISRCIGYAVHAANIQSFSNAKAGSYLALASAGYGLSLAVICLLLGCW